MALARWVVAGLAAAGIAGSSFLVAPGAAEAAASRELVRLSLLDACVMGEWHKRQDTSKIADECRCAAQKAAGQLSPQQVAAYKNRLDKSGEAAWDAATRACFKSVTASSKP